MAAPSLAFGEKILVEQLAFVGTPAVRIIKKKITRLYISRFQSRFRAREK